MAGLFTEEDKAEVNDMFFLLHDTFAKTVKVYNESKKVVKQKNPNYNALYSKNNRDRGNGLKLGHNNTKNIDEDSARTLEYETNTSEIEARVTYDRRLNLDNVGGEASTQLKVKQVNAEIKITVRETDFETVRNAKRFEVAGIKYYRNSEFRPQGFFDTIFYSFYCSATEAR